MLIFINNMIINLYFSYADETTVVESAPQVVYT